MIYMFLSNNPSSGDINSSNLSCFSCYSCHLFFRNTIRVSNGLVPVHYPYLLSVLILVQTVRKGYQPMTSLLEVAQQGKSLTTAALENQTDLTHFHREKAGNHL